MLATTALLLTPRTPRSAARRHDAAARLCHARSTVVFAASALPDVKGGASGASAVVRFPRSRLDIKLAVLLLRSSYETVDELDFIPMDRFQQVFWKRRAAEQEAYLALLSPLRVQQGDLTDALYFDFLCFVQLLVIGEQMKVGEQVFQEATGAEGDVQTVRRDARLADNAALPEEYARRVGDKVFTRLRDGFEEESFGGPKACAAADVTCAADGVASLLRCFESRGFAFSARVTDVDEAARRLRVHVEGGATLFATAELAARRSSPPPAFLEYTLHAFLRASGWPEAAIATRASRTGLDIDVSLAPS